MRPLLGRVALRLKGRPLVWLTSCPVGVPSRFVQDAVDCATQALEKYNIEKDVAAYIKKEFDKKYNPTWYVLRCVASSASLWLWPLRALSNHPLAPSSSWWSVSLQALHRRP